MELEPVPHSRPPAYPTRREVLAGAASFVLVNLAGGGSALAGPQPEKIAVAPIFEHGAGRGATGCIVISPPVFLSEEEGVQVLREELVKHGIQLKGGETWEAVRVPARIERFKVVDKGEGETEFKEWIEEVPERAKPLELDGIDRGKGVAVEFVSREDYFDLGGPASASTVQIYDFKKVAEHVAEHVKKQGKEPVAVGVFYDPLGRMSMGDAKADEKTDWHTAWTIARKKGKEESKALLRQQARDFVGWLEKRKAIR